VLKFLLDEQLTPRIAVELARRRPDIPILSLQSWEGGRFRGIDDARLLTAAREEELTLVTYDQRTIAPLLRHWADQGLSHAGVVFANRGIFRSNDIGGLTWALTCLWDMEQALDWIDRVIYLQRPPTETAPGR
jgi:hypothetical protein